MFTGLNTPEDYLRAIKNHKWLVIIPIVLCVCIAGALCYWLPKSYRSTTLLYFQEQKVRFVKGVDAPESGQDPRPDAAMGARIDALKEFLYRQELLLQVAEEFHLYDYEKESASPVIDSIVASRLRRLVNIDPQPQGGGLFKVSFADEQPNVANGVTARLANLFIQEHSKSRSAIAQSSAEFLQHEMDMLKKQLEAKEQALAQFKQTHLGQLPEQMDSNMRAIDRLEAEVTTQQEMEKTLAMRLESVDKAIREYEDPTSDPKRAEKDPRLAKIKELQRTLAGMQSIYKETYPDVARVRHEIKQLQAMTTEEYIALYIDQDPMDPDGAKKPKRKMVDPYKAELLKQRDELVREQEMIRVRQARIATDIKKYESRIEGTTIHQQELMIMQRDYDNLQRNYQSLLEKKMTIGMAGDLEQKRQGTQMRIVEPASFPTWPEKPNLLMLMFGGLAAGCALGFGGAIGIEMLRRGFVSAEEIETTLGLPVIAAISHYETAWPGGGKLAKPDSHRQDRFLALPALAKEDSLVPNGAQVAVGPELVAMWYPRSAVAEQYRVAATRLGLMVGKQESTVVVMCSATMGEGKTSTALNLAHVLARDLNKKTVLVDCDLKRPMVHAYAGMELCAGVSDVLIGQKRFEECLEYHEQLGIWILSAGVNLSGTSALTHVERLSALITSLRAGFEYIVIDAPPLLPVAETMLIVRMADIVAHVIRARTTGRDLVRDAIKMIGEERALGVILNGVEEKDAPYSYYTYGSSVYEPHHKQLR